MAQQDGRRIELHVPEDVRRGVYSNNLVVGHTKEEFIMDFVLLAGEDATLTARVITSPGHMKRVLGAMRHNVELYERTHGTIDEDGAQADVDFQAPTKH